MPQLLGGGLSERWLLKECGDVHWNLVCRDLQVPSGQLVDQTDERLYASFLRVRVESTGLRRIPENAELALSAELARFSTKRFFSELRFEWGAEQAQVQLASVFVTRRGDNKSLARAAPRGIAASTCGVHEVVPPFGQGYQLVKQCALEGVDPGPGALTHLGGEPFGWPAGELFRTTYAINPYHDLNGVNLLYFASYPRIHDVCERAYVHGLAARRGLRGEWALSAAPLARDVYYYGNADPGDELTFQLRSCEFVGRRRVKLVSSLFRDGGRERIADLFTLKHLAAPDDPFAFLWNEQDAP